MVRSLACRRSIDHTMLKHMLSVADRKGLIQTNVAQKVRMPYPKNERDRVLTKQEWERLIDAASPTDRPFFQLPII